VVDLVACAESAPRCLLVHRDDRLRSGRVLCRLTYLKGSKVDRSTNVKGSKVDRSINVKGSKVDWSTNVRGSEEDESKEGKCRHDSFVPITKNAAN
jgi:hypothetical protein